MWLLKIWDRLWTRKSTVGTTFIVLILFLVFDIATFLGLIDIRVNSNSLVIFIIFLLMLLEVDVYDDIHKLVGDSLDKVNKAHHISYNRTTEQSADAANKIIDDAIYKSNSENVEIYTANLEHSIPGDGTLSVFDKKIIDAMKDSTKNYDINYYYLIAETDKKTPWCKIIEGSVPSFL